LVADVQGGLIAKVVLSNDLGQSSVIPGLGLRLRALKRGYRRLQMVGDIERYLYYMYTHWV